MASSAGSTDVFSNYEHDLDNLLRSVKTKMEQLAIQAGEERKSTVRSVEREMDEMDEILSQMQMELLNIPSPSRIRLQARLRLFKTEGEKLRRDLRRMTTVIPSYQSINSDRHELLGEMNYENDLDASSADQRQRLLNGTQQLGNSSQRLQESHRIALETEGIGINILHTLRGQRETMLRTRDTLAEADSHIDKSSRTLKSMARR
ncbi:t-SNARE [Radiomyces spectabilis]|uniref:t-SNARE n=1 Tax=Radiomyces spectabilis TaxID=64574 RepID=UPI002220A56F|nr:t-SNARE [Radiomyces spectabilis]KAI8379222.1 t-SNARE [Radiomyces spectabilis]